MAERGRLIRLARGVYAARDEYDGPGPWRQFELRSRAYALTCAPFTFLAEWAAATVWELPALGKPPAVPTVIQHKARTTGSTKTPRAHIRVAKTPSSHWLLSGHPDGPRVPIMSPAWTVADLARTAPVHHALAAADAALHADEPVREVADAFIGWDGASRMRWVLDHADPLAESPLETLGRFTCIQFKLPIPVTNAWIGDRRPEKRVDGLWPWHGVAYEADGALKYDSRPDASQIVIAEKEREWRIRHELGVDVVRYDWELGYRDRSRLAARFQTALARNPIRAEPVRWWRHDSQLGPISVTAQDQPSPHATTITLPVSWSRDLSTRS